MAETSLKLFSNGPFPPKDLKKSDVKGFDPVEMQQSLDGGFKHFLFSPLFGEMIQFDEHIFQRGWFNHQLETTN